MKKYHINYETLTPTVDVEKLGYIRSECEYGDVSEGRLLEAVTAILKDPTRSSVIITRCEDEH